MRAAGYIRVSTPAQAEEDKVSLREQRQDIEDYCSSKGYTLVKWYQDVGSGASKRRSGFQQMLRDAQDGEFDIIVCWKADRLSRGLYPAAALGEALEGTDIALEAVKDAIDRTTFDLMAVVGKIELNNIQERARMGARGRAGKGRIAGTPKYGYAIGEDHKPVIVEEEAKVVRRMFQEYAGGSGCRSITSGLMRDGILTRKGKDWTIPRILEVISHPAYMGAGVYGKKQYYKKDDGDHDVRRHRKMPEESWVTIEFPRIIDDVTWEQAQRERKSPTRGSWRRDRIHEAHYMLKGLLWCGHCAKRYRTKSELVVQYRTNKDGTKYKKPTNTVRTRYACINGTGPGSHCPTSYVSAKRVEHLVWKVVTDVLTKPDQVRALLEEQERYLQEGGTLTQLERARNQMETVDAERGRAFQLFQKSYITEKELDVRMRSITERLEFHTEQAKQLEAEASQVADRLARLEDFRSTTRQITARLDTMTGAEKVDVVHALVSRVTVVGKGQYQLVLAIDREGTLSTESTT